MKCFQCDKEIKNELDMELLNADGDFGCNKQCKEAYEKEKAHFLNVVIHDNKLFHDWLRI